MKFQNALQTLKPSFITRFFNLYACTFKLVELYQISLVLFDVLNLWLSSKELKNKFVEKFCVSADVKHMLLYLKAYVYIFGFAMYLYSKT